MASKRGQQIRTKVTQEQILDAATSCFARQGYERTSTATIARAAGVSQGLIFHHFVTKEGLFVAIVRKALERFADCVAQAQQSQLEPAARIKKLLHLVGEVSLENPQRTDIIIRQIFAMGLNPAIVEMLGVMQVIEAIRDALAQGQARGAFRDVDSHSAALSIWGIYIAHYVGWTALQQGEDFVVALDGAIAMFLEGIAQR